MLPFSLSVGSGAVWVEDSSHEPDTLLRIRPGSGSAMGFVADCPCGAPAFGAGAAWADSTGYLNHRSIYRLAGEKAEVVGRVRLGFDPSSPEGAAYAAEIAVGEGGVWVANPLADSVTRIDPRTNRLAETFPTAGLYEVYGMTEGFVTVAVPEDWERGKRGSVGVPLYACDIRIIDEAGNEVPRGEAGEIAGYSPGLMKGYYNAPELTREIIWRGPWNRTYLRSGDIGRLDEDGFLYIEGSVKDMIKSGGLNVFAADIEEVFSRHPDVVEVAAIAIPHSKWGETPLLLAIMRAGSSVNADELREWGNAQLGKYQRVSAVEFRMEFPRATYDKVRKQELRAPYWAGQSD